MIVWMGKLAFSTNTRLVVDSAEDTTTASRNLPSAMRKLGAELDPEAASRRGLPPDTPNVLVVPHGNILEDFNNNSAWV